DPRVARPRRTDRGTAAAASEDEDPGGRRGNEFGDELLLDGTKAVFARIFGAAPRARIIGKILLDDRRLVPRSHAERRAASYHDRIVPRGPGACQRITGRSADAG